jgi:hypothetical protein
MEANLKYRNLPNQYDLWMLDIISIKRFKAKYGHVNATVQVWIILHASPLSRK